jgi:hypothetical protein
LQRAADLLAHVVDERSEHLGFVVARQPAFFLGAAGFFHAEAVGTHHFFGELLPAEREVARVDDLQIAQHAERGAARAEVDDRDDAAQPAVRHLMSQQTAGVLERERFDVDDLRGQARSGAGGNTLLDVLRARGHEQYVEHVRIFFRRTDDLEVEADFFHRERDVLVGLHLHLALELVLAQGARHLDHLGDRRVAADGHRRVFSARAGALHCALDGFADGTCVDDGFFVD